MTNELWQAFFGELEKTANFNPLTAKGLLKSLATAGKLALVGGAGYLGFKGLKAFTAAISELSSYPEFHVSERRWR